MRQTFKHRIEAVVSLRGRCGAHAYDVVRLRNPKDFRQRLDGSGASRASGGCSYRLPELLAARRAPSSSSSRARRTSTGREALAWQRRVPGGGRRWRDDFASCLTSRRVVIIPDNDEQGEAHAEASSPPCAAAALSRRCCGARGCPTRGTSVTVKAGGTPEKLVEMAQALLQPSCDLTPTPFQWIDPASIPPRPWLYGRHLIRKQVSVTVAAGGDGKSSLTIAEAVAMTSGRICSATGCPARSGSGCSTSKIPAMNCSGASSRRYSTIASRRPRSATGSSSIPAASAASAPPSRCATGVSILEPEVEALEAALKERQIDVLVVDPFVSSHQVAGERQRRDRPRREGMGAHRRSVQLRDRARAPRPEDQRRRGHQRGRARRQRASQRCAVGRVLNRMDRRSSGPRLASSDSSTYFSITRDKANLAPEGKRVWRRMASVDLGQGDHVGVAEAWEWPDAFAGVTLGDLLRCPASDRRQGPALLRPVGGLGRLQGGGGAGLDAVVDRKRIKRLIADWLKSGALVKGSKEGPQRREVPTLEVGRMGLE